MLIWRIPTDKELQHTLVKPPNPVGHPQSFNKELL